MKWFCFTVILYTSLFIAPRIHAKAKKFFYESQAGLGFAVVTHSSLGLSQAQGSSLRLSTQRHLSKKWLLGFQTLGIGGQNTSSKRYQQLATGPLLSFNWGDSHRIETAFQWFQESARQDNTMMFQSKGISLFLGLGRHWTFPSGAKIVWSVFFIHDWGKLTHQPALAFYRHHPMNYQRQNRGCELALRFPF